MIKAMHSEGIKPVNDIQISDLSKRTLLWISSFHLSAEHWLMIAVVTVSTAHVMAHMRKVEGSWFVAGIMGIVLGCLNAFFAFRYFEAKGATRRPAIFGLSLSVAVGVYMQYSFYDTNENLTPYFWGWVNLAALLSGLWAPLFEMILGWLYGVRMSVVNAQNDQLAIVVNQWSTKLAAIETKYSQALMVNQESCDREYELKEQLKEKEAGIDQLRAQLTDLKTDRAVLNERLNITQHSPTPQVVKNPVKSTKRLSTNHRRDTIKKMNASGELLQYNVTSLADHRGVQRGTLRSDLEELNITLSTQR